MRNSKSKYFPLVITLFIGIFRTGYGQIPDFSKVPNVHEGDSLNITYLIGHGVMKSFGKVIAWFPKDSLPETRMLEIVVMIDSGIRGAEKFINAPFDWQLQQPDKPYTYYFRSDKFISHASGAGFISIPFWRIKNGKSPWLHEAIHEMLNTKTGSWLSNDISEKDWSENMPLWLFEGLADYISLKVSLIEVIPWFDVFSNDYASNADSLFVNDSKTPNAPYIISFIGNKGTIPELFSNDRIHYAPLFYHGSCSFVQFIAENYNIRILVTAISSFKQEQVILEKLTGEKIEILKKEWLDKLKIGK